MLVGTAYPMRGGIAHYIALLYHTLTNRNHQVFVLSFSRQYPNFLFPGKTQKDQGKELMPVPSVPLLDSINPLTWVRAFFWLKQIKPDLLVFKYWMPFFAPCYAIIAFLTSRILRVRTMAICDNIVPHEKKLFDSFFSWLGLRFIDYFIVQSRSVRDDLLHLKPEAVYREVPHPVYEIFPPPLSKNKARKRIGIQDNKVILYFGYIRRYKGLLHLIRAMPKLLKAMKIKLLVCGEFYEDREETYRLVDRLELKSNVILYDQFVPNEEVNRYFCASDLVVLPYTSATQSGIVQVAYHYDKPVVVTRVGGLPEVVIDNRTGYVVEPNDPDALAEAVLKYYRKQKEKAFVRNIRKEKKKYSWDRMAEAIESFG